MKGEFQVIRIGICVFSHFIGRSSLASWTASIMTWNATLSHPLPKSVLSNLQGMKWIQPLTSIVSE